MDIPTPSLPQPKIKKKGDNKLTKSPQKVKDKKKVKYLDQYYSKKFLDKYFNDK